ncbi:glycoside hydrolase, partial [Parabacteroides sp. OttesenSCG-928-N08]|nr:glycoside hydrolase [Parabacteroides sp. OttesenSCG-928-N08]
MKKIYTIGLVLFCCLAGCLTSIAQSDHTTAYARKSMKASLEIEWTANNFGTIQWQRSTDNGESWTDIPNANEPTYEFTATSNGLYRAKIETQEACEPIYIVREVKTVDFTITVSALDVRAIEFEVKGFNPQDADIVEYGFCYNCSDINTRNYRDMYRVPINAPPPETEDFYLLCEDLEPGTSYSVRLYFKTADGSIVFGPGRIGKTLSGVDWSAEDWTINKQSIAAAFELKDYNSTMGNPNLSFKFGSSLDDLKPYEVVERGNDKYSSELIDNLQPNTTYFAQVEATVDGDKQVITKEVKTLSDYSSFEVDESTDGVQHTILWDKTKTLHQISPVGLQTEYPRIIRLNADTLLCSYHGGTKGDYWVNVYLQKSFDNGQSWTAPTLLLDKESSNLGNRYWRFTNPEMTKLKNGWIIMSVTANGNPETNDNCHVMVMLSKDNGETWGDPKIMGRGRTWEPMIIQLPNGELELYVSSEAQWWRTGKDPLPQEILFSRSTDNGETWSELKRASYSPDRRDGMPVALVMQGNKGVLFSIEIVNDWGFGSPSLVRRDLNGEWDATGWDGINSDYRWKVNLNAHGGAPSLLQLPTGEIVVMAHVNARGVWQTSYPRVTVGDSNGKNFTTPVTP